MGPVEAQQYPGLADQVLFPVQGIGQGLSLQAVDTGPGFARIACGQITAGKECGADRWFENHMAAAVSAQVSGILESFHGFLVMPQAEGQVTSYILDDYMLSGFGTLVHMLQQGGQVGCGLIRLVAFAADLSQCAVQPAGYQARLAGICGLSVHPLLDAGGGRQCRIKVAPVILYPGQQPAAGEQGAGLLFGLAVAYR